jgi:hypothetical protein
MPERIQRRRYSGWRAPLDAVYVGRGSRWGNPIVVSGSGQSWRVGLGAVEMGTFPTRQDANRHAVAAFRWQLDHHPNVLGFTAVDIRDQLAGRDLMCWCDLALPCHADVLIDIANGGDLHAHH